MEDKKNNRSALRSIVIILAVLLALVLLSNAAMFIIGMKTNYLHRWGGEQYFGEIIEINSKSFMIQGRGNGRKTVLITGGTVMKKGTETVRDTLQIGDRVIIIGPLNKEGQIEAQLIRIFDSEDAAAPQDFFWPPFSK